MGSAPVISETWRYAIIGGVGSIPLTVGLYWLSATGNELSLNMVFVGGIAAGYLAKRGGADTDRVGLRAGVLGGLPGLWLLLETARGTVGIPSPVPLQVISIFLLIGAGGVALTIGGLAGLIGAKFGAWLATTLRSRGSPSSGS